MRSYHQLLWSKPLPGGERFELTEARPGTYLYHHSAQGEFFLASDSIIHTLDTFGGMPELIDQVTPKEMGEFHRLGYTIGGFIVFPSQRIDGKSTMNGARGMHPGIRDRFDLTLECIRRHYSGAQRNPLSAVLERYRSFFGLFRDFRGYVEFFLLQDLVAEDHSSVRFFTEFEDFPTAPLPRSLNAYEVYRQRSVDFVTARNARIAEYSG